MRTQINVHTHTRAHTHTHTHTQVSAIAEAADANEHAQPAAAGIVMHTPQSGSGSDVRAAPEWWAGEAKKEVGFGAETEWVKGLGQRHMAGVCVCVCVFVCVCVCG